MPGLWTFCIAILALAVLSAAGCRCPCRTAQPSRVQHVVLVWLKEPGNAEARRQIIEVSQTFREIPGVLDVRAGQVLPSERPIVDSTFDVAIVVTLADADAMPAYLDHPLHKAAAAEVLNPVAARVLVYDFTE